MHPLIFRAALRLSRRTRFQARLDDWVESAQYLMGIGAGTSTASSGEQVLVRVLKERAAQIPLCIFDVGANKGDFVRMLETALQVPFRVFAFEPGAHTFTLLQAAVREFDNVTLENAGLGQAPGTATLYSDHAGSGLASLSKRRLDHFGIDMAQTESVRLDSVDAYCARCGIERIDLLKLDVEGHELDVLQGAVRMFQERRIRMVTFEFGGCNIDTRTFLQDFWYFFSANGMRQMFRLTPAGALVPLPRYRERDEQFRTTNFMVLMDGASLA